jgi:hypothetical protein
MCVSGRGHRGQSLLFAGLHPRVAEAIRIGTLLKVSPVETSVSEQVMTRSVGIGPWKIPCGITAMGDPTPAADGGVGEVARNGAMPGQLTTTVSLCGDWGVPAAAAAPALARVAAIAATKMIRKRCMAKTSRQVMRLPGFSR